MLLYIIGIIATFNHITEVESTKHGCLNQRELIYYFAASLVWPLVALGMVFECRRELKEMLFILLDIQLQYPEPDLEYHGYNVDDLAMDEVDPETI
mgnify:CR=1 FL=1